METKINNEINITQYIENLAPVIDGENQEIYIELLKKGINDKKVKNIALSGSYGSGKSSILQKLLSTLTLKEQEKYLEISLANFDDNIKPDEEQQHIEKSILQQIFYKVSKNELPYSKLERTEKKTKKSIFGNTMVLFTWLISLFIFIKTSEVKKVLVDLFAIQDLNIQSLFIWSSFLLLLSTFYIIYIIIKGTGKIRLNKLSFQGVNLDIEDKSGSLINKHLDEILYFFETTPYEVLLIEDLDRQDGTKIFQKLREINTLLNNYSNINKKKKVTFVYAVKDSIFTGEERTKFFELIVPVVPIINTSNAKDILIKKFTKMGIIEKLSEDFLKDISYHIHNYRQLTNIVNEFCIYQEALKNTKDYKKLFALIVYKNFYPKDFSDLQNREGMLYNVFHNKKQEIKDKIILKLDNDLEEIDTRVENIKKEHLSNERELKLIFASKLFEEVNDLKLFYNNGSPTTISQLVDNEKLFNSYVIKGGSLDYYYNYSSDYISTTRATFKGDKSGEFEKRLKILKDIVLEEKNQLSKEKEELQSKIREIKYEELSKLLKREEKDNLLDLEQLKEEKDEITEEDKRNWKLIQKLLIDGNIDEYYSRYISYFHEGELTRNDYDFIGKIKDRESLDFIYGIDNIEVVVNELSVNDFKNDIENFSVAEYMFENSKINDKRKYFINNFFENSSDEFIRELLEKNLQNQNLISSILKEAGNRIRLNKLFNILNDNSINALLIILINNLKDIKISLTDKDEFNILLSRLLFDVYNKIERTEVLEKHLISEQIIFDEVSAFNYKQSEKLFNFIYENSFYKLTYENIKSILINLFNSKESEEIKLKTANLTTIKESEAKELINNIDENINLYFDECFYKLEDNIKEPEETLLYLLNHEELKKEHKKDIIVLSENKITNIISIEDKDQWVVLFQENKVVADWDNILYYYQESEKIDDVIIKYLNNEENYIHLSKFKINNDKLFDKSEVLNPFNTKLILSNNLSDEAYKHLIKSVWFINYQTLSFEDLSKSKIDSILSTNILSLTQDNIDKLKEIFIPKHIGLIEKKKDDFLEKINEFSITSYDILKILNSLEFTDEEKFQIIETIDISAFNENLELKEKASKLYIDNHRKIENLSLFEKLFYNKDNKINEWALKLYVSQIDSWTCDECQTYIVEFDKPYNELLEKSASPLTFKDTKLNRQLFQVLKDKDCISSFDPKISMMGKDEIKVNRKRS